MDVTNLYQKLALTEVKRFLSLLDREHFSSTSGSFDRTFWCWKFTDFPGARFQEGVYSLAHLYSYPFPENGLAKNSVVFRWIREGFKYWQKIQYTDGSFDEAYPFEHSLAATAFTSFYVGEAFLLLKDQLSESEVASLKGSFEKAANWLCENDEEHGILSNHLAAAAAALCVISKITGEQKFQQRMNYFLKKIYKHQAEEGWYEEYGGADPGYQTHAMFYLARIWQHTGDKELLESLKKATSFLKYFIHPNRTLGGEYASRNTEFYYPAGLEILANHIPEAAHIAGFMRKSVAEQKSAGLSAMDAYNFFPLFNNYLFASLNTKPLDESGNALPFRKIEEHLFSDAGLFVKSTNHYYSIFGLSKGGTLKVFDKKQETLTFCDSGYIAETKEGKAFSNQSFSDVGSWSVDGESASLTCRFVSAKRKVLNPWLFIGFRFFTLTFGRMKTLAYWVKNLLVNVLVKKQVEAPLVLQRKIQFKDREIEIVDELILDGTLDLIELKSYPKFATIHMGSSRYFQIQDLLNLEHETQKLAPELMAKKRVIVTKKIEFPTLIKESDRDLSRMPIL